MKKIFTPLLLICVTFSLYAQVPQKMSYQFVVRNASGALVAGTPVGLRVAILQGSPTGTIVYHELFNPNPVTNSNGLVSVEIGTGLPITGTFSSINWAGGPYYLKTETDPAGGTSYTVVGTSQLLSVPYALYSKISESIADNSVTSAKIVDGTIATADLANSSVTSVKIADGNVGNADLFDGGVTSAKIADGTIVSGDLADNSVTTSKILDATIVTADLANGTVTSAKIGDGNVTTADLADNSVTTAKIVDGTVSAADIQDRTRNIVFPANALNFDKASTILTQTANGITWKSNYSSPAFLTIPKPLDWMEASNVTLKLYFMVTTASGGAVAFFIRPRSYNDGDTFADASSISPVSPINIPASSQYKTYSQSFIIPYSRFGAKNLWVVTIQRQGTGETYADDVILMAIEIVYTAVQ